MKWFSAAFDVSSRNDTLTLILLQNSWLLLCVWHFIDYHHWYYLEIIVFEIYFHGLYFENKMAWSCISRLNIKAAIDYITILWLALKPIIIILQIIMLLRLTPFAVITFYFALLVFNEYYFTHFTKRWWFKYCSNFRPFYFIIIFCIFHFLHFYYFYSMISRKNESERNVLARLVHYFFTYNLLITKVVSGLAWC